MKTIEERVKELVEEHLGITDQSRVKTTSHLVEDLGADSLDIVELVMAVEEEFHIELSDGDVEKVDTVQDFVTLIRRKGGFDG